MQNKWFRCLLLLAYLCLISTLFVTAQNSAAPSQIAITHVTVINPGTSTVQSNRTVVIIGDRITAVSDASHWQSKQGTR
jgi:hypothetical protein